MKTVLVTGGAGYIGSHACKVLASAGFIPVAFDNISTGWVDSVQFGPLERGDLLNKSDLNAVFEKYKPNAIMHFAAASQVSDSVFDPGKYWSNNLTGSLNLIETAVKHGCLDLVHSSTCAIYGDHGNTTLTEGLTQKPLNPYGASKRAVEEVIKHFSISYGLRYVVFRYFNVAGADPEAKIGEFHKPETHLIPVMFDALSGKQETFKIFGTNYNTPDGTCIRDFIHVCDLVDAHLLGLKWLQNGGYSFAANLGSGSGFSVMETMEVVNRVTRQTVPVQYGERRDGDSPYLVSGSELAKSLLGWSDKRSDLETIVTDAWRWYQKVNYLK